MSAEIIDLAHRRCLKEAAKAQEQLPCDVEPMGMDEALVQFFATAFDPDRMPK